MQNATRRTPPTLAVVLDAAAVTILCVAGRSGGTFFPSTSSSGMLPAADIPSWAGLVSIVGWTSAVVVALGVAVSFFGGIGSAGSARRARVLSRTDTIAPVAAPPACLLLFAASVLPMAMADASF